MNAYTKVENARKSTRPTALYYIKKLTENSVEFHGDRYFGDDGAIVGGIATLNGMPVTVIGMERGASLEERMKRNFGCPSPEGYRKALRLMKQAEKFKRPVICFVASPGAYCGIGAEQRGQGEAIARNLMEMMTLKTPVISVIVGEGGSGGALALSVADTVVMLENSVYSVISPEGCASILWKDSSKADEAAEILKLTADDLRKFEIIDMVVDETNADENEIVEKLKALLIDEIIEKSSLKTHELLKRRYEKFRNIGKFKMI